MDTNVTIKCLSMKILICIKQHVATFEAHFMKKSSRVELKKKLIKKGVVRKRTIDQNVT